MLSHHEQQVWDDIERHYAIDGVEPVPPAQGSSDRPGPDDLPAAVVAGTWITILLVLLGAPTAGFATGGVTALGWALWRLWPRPRSTGASTGCR